MTGSAPSDRLARGRGRRTCEWLVPTFTWNTGESPEKVSGVGRAEAIAVPYRERVLVRGGRIIGGSIELGRHLPVSAARVWEALVDPAQVGTWFAARATITPERGGAYELFWQPDTPDHDSTIGCRITAISPSRYLAFTWRGPDELSAIMNEGDPPPPPTHVTIVLTPTPTGTDLQVQHVGFGDGEGWSRARAWHERAWATCLSNLEAWLTGRSLPHPWGD